MKQRALSERTLIAVLAACTAAGPVALSVYLPILPLVQSAYGVSVGAANLTVSLPLAAFAVGLLLWGPVSDHRGRRPVMLTGLGIHLLGSLAALVAPALGWLTLARMIQALGSAAGVTVARAVIGDVFPHERMARMIAYLTMVMLLANSLAPVAGGALGSHAGWRAVFVLLAAAAIPVWIVAWRLLPETRHGPDPGATTRPLAATRALLANRAFMGVALLSGIVYAQFFAWTSLMPYVFKDTLGHSPAEYGAWYLCISGGYFLGNLYLSRNASRRGTSTLLATGLACSAGAAAVALALALTGQWQPIALFGPWALIAFGQGLSLPVLTANAVGHAPRAAGAASGVLGFTQQVLSAITIQMVSGSSTASPVPAVAWCLLFGVAGWAGPHLARRLSPLVTR